MTNRRREGREVENRDRIGSDRGDHFRRAGGEFDFVLVAEMTICAVLDEPEARRATTVETRLVLMICNCDIIRAR